VPRGQDAADREIKRQVALLLGKFATGQGQGVVADCQAGQSVQGRPPQQRRLLFGGRQARSVQAPTSGGGVAGEAPIEHGPVSSGSGSSGSSSGILRGGAQPMVCIVSDDLTFVETLGRCRAAGCATVSVCEKRVEMGGADVTLNWAAVQDGSYVQAAAPGGP
jgi:hypothetical protein